MPDRDPTRDNCACRHPRGFHSNRGRCCEAGCRCDDFTGHPPIGKDPSPTGKKGKTSAKS